ncbi:MAG: hypothetical protein IJ341_10440 [Bacteroidales bacterium]|nr:hypothetical protein [Bacteroidales bacterium]
MTINLPAIGNMMSDAWDIIHGPLRNNARTDINGSLQGRLDSFTDMNVNAIPVKRAADGTLVGSYINGNTNKTVTAVLEEDLSESFESDDAWIKTSINSIGLDNKTDLSGIAIHHTFHPKANSTTTVDKNTGDYSEDDNYDDAAIPIHHIQEDDDIIAFYVPYVDKAGHVVGYNTERVTLPYNFKTIKTNGVSAVTSNPLVTQNVDIVADNSQDDLTFAAGNKWIRMANNPNNDTLTIGHEVHAFTTTSNGTTNLNEEDGAIDENNINIPDWDYDEAGHIKSKQNHYYTLPFSFKTITTNGRSEEVSENAIGTPVTANVVADTTQDTLAINSGNKWIRIDTDATNDGLTIRHDVHKTSNTTSTKTLVSETGVTTFDVPTYAFDEAGHYTSHDTKTITVPFGYGKIKGDNGSTAATATYDEVTFASDEWLTATVTKDTVAYSHDYPKKIDDTTSESNVNGKGDTIVLETLERDDKGHVIKVNQNTVTLPFGYKTFTGDSGTTSANNTQDSISVTGDSWVQTTVSDDKIAFAHIGPVSGTATEVSAETPAFGATFSIDDHYFDDKGHKFTSKSHTVKIPLPSLATNGTGNVVTDLSLVSTTGALTATKVDLGAIKLGTYDGGDNSDDLTADITLQQALSRL